MAQEALLTAFRKIRQWRGDGSFAGWLKAIATRRFLDDRRSRLARTTREMLTADDASANPDQRIDVDRAVSALPPRERAVCLLTYAYGHSQSETAAMLSMPLGTVKTLAARGKAALIQKLGEPS